MNKAKPERKTHGDSGKQALTLAAGIAALSVSIGVDVDDVLAAAVEAPAAPAPAFESIKGQTAPAVGLQFEGSKDQTVPSGNVATDISKVNVAPPKLPAQQSKDRVVRPRSVPESPDGGAEPEKAPSPQP